MTDNDVRNALLQIMRLTVQFEPAIFKGEVFDPRYVTALRLIRKIADEAMLAVHENRAPAFITRAAPSDDP